MIRERGTGGRGTPPGGMPLGHAPGARWGTIFRGGACPHGGVVYPAASVHRRILGVGQVVSRVASRRAADTLLIAFVYYSIDFESKRKE